MDKSTISIIMSGVALLISAIVAVHQINRSNKESRISRAIALSAVRTQAVEAIIFLERISDELHSISELADAYELTERVESSTRLYDKAKDNLEEVKKAYDKLLMLQDVDQEILEDLRHDFESLRLRAADIGQDTKSMKTALDQAINT